MPRKNRRNARHIVRMTGHPWLPSVRSRLKRDRISTARTRSRLLPVPRPKGGRRDGPAAHSLPLRGRFIVFPLAGECRHNLLYPGEVPPEIDDAECGDGGQEEFCFVVQSFHYFWFYCCGCTLFIRAGSSSRWSVWVICGFCDAVARQHRRTLCECDARSILPTLEPSGFNQWLGGFLKEGEPLARATGGSLVATAGGLGCVNK